MNTQGQAGASGLYEQTFSSTYGGQTHDVTVEVDLLEVPSFSLTGPGEDRLLVAPGSNASMQLHALKHWDRQPLPLFAALWPSSRRDGHRVPPNRLPEPFVFRDRPCHR